MSILLDKQIIERGEAIPVYLVGVGGTGSHMLVNLAMINYSLKAMDQYGFDVTAYDPDIVEPVNVGRQMFLPNEIGENKATSLIRRVNLSYGLSWHSIPLKFIRPDRYNHGSIVISCVDSAKSRTKIGKELKEFRNPVYWIDIGNSYDYGQIIIGYNGGSNRELKFITEKYDIAKYDKPEEPSCSMSASLKKQDLFVNKIMADYAGHLLWKMLTLNKIYVSEFFLNLTSLNTSKKVV